MMCKFLKLNSQDPRLGLLYVSGALDANGVSRDEVTLLRGNPDDFERVVSSLSFNERYKSFVAAWSPGDAPDANQMDRFLADLDRLCFGDLDPSRFCTVAYMHRKGDKVDLHVLLANVELSTGKQFNAAPPGWKRGFDALRDMHNAREGWASPADPKLARLVQPGAKPNFKDARARKGRVTPTSVKAELIAFATELVEGGLVPNREALIKALGQKGRIHRDNAKFITVIPTGLDKHIRLRGAMFEQGFNFAGPVPICAPRPSRTAKDHEADRDPVAEELARQRFEAVVAKRHADNIPRYKPRRKRASAKDADQGSRLHQEEFHEVSVPGKPPDLTVDPGSDAEALGPAAANRVAFMATTAAPLMPPQLLLAIPTFSSTAAVGEVDTAIGSISDIETNINFKTKEEHNEGSYRSAFPRIAAALARDLRERFEQLAHRIVEFGNNIRSQRWLNSARFDGAGVAIAEPGTAVPDASAKPDQTPTLTNSKTRPKTRP